jgi:GNAT superfamily N-acetyltransferase
MTDCEIKFVHCDWEEIRPLVVEYIVANNIIIESDWEDHVLESRHYKMVCRGKTAGYFAIHKGSVIWLFNVFPPYANKAQELFGRAKKYENVTGAMVATGDEFLMSHCLDDFVRIEKQAYFSAYTEKEISAEFQKEITLRLADIDRDLDILKLGGDFFGDIIKQVKNGALHIEIYIAEAAKETIGFGIIDYGRIIKDITSIGMYVCEQHRQQGYAANILQHLKRISLNKGCRVFSGCWYYNHSSKKAMERAGAYSKTRLIRFYF